MSLAKITKLNKENIDTTYYGDWLGLAGGSAVDIALVSNPLYAAGTFGDNVSFGYPLADGEGTGADYLQEDTDYQYDKRLDASTTEDATNGFGSTAGGIYDTGTSGSLSSGKYLRVVENGENVKTSTGNGLGLIVYAKRLINLTATPPPKTKAYVDPVTGIVKLPQPIYWSKCENTTTSLTNPEIYDSRLILSTYTGYGGFGSQAGKFGNCVSNYATDPSSRDGFIVKPWGNDASLGKGAVSFWSLEWFSHPGSAYDCRIIYSVGADFWDGLYTDKMIWWAFFRDAAGTTHQWLGYANVQKAIAYNGYSTSWRHWFITWDKDKSLSGGKSCRVWLNGTEIMSTTDDIPLPYSPYYFRMSTMGNSAACQGQVDNLKIWCDPIDDPSFEYNSGTGREDALHDIYASAYGYKPSNLSVGYYFIGTNNTPATCPKPGANEIVELEDPIDNGSCVGLFGSPTVICKNDYSPLVSSTDFLYDKRLDVSTTEDPTNGYGSISGGIFDTGASGSFSSAKYIRIVHNGHNIKDSVGVGGLASQIWAEDSSVEAGRFPTYDKCYIDPLRGAFYLPRPVFWSKFEDESSEIGSYLIVENLGYTTAFSSIESGSNGSVIAKFTKGLYVTAANNLEGAEGGSGVKIIPAVPNLEKGTISFWYSSYPIDGTSTSWAHYFNMHLTINTYIRFYHHHSVGIINQIYVNGSVVASAGTYGMEDGVTNNLYIVFDKDVGIKVYRNGTLYLSTSSTWDSGSNPYLHIWNDTTNPGRVSSITDNLKIWKDYIDDPSFEYNSGTGREDALHTIYGSASGYKPALTSASYGGVGYYKASGTGVYSRWKINND